MEALRVWIESAENSGTSCFDERGSSIGARQQRAAWRNAICGRIFDLTVQRPVLTARNLLPQLRACNSGVAGEKMLVPQDLISGAPANCAEASEQDSAELYGRNDQL